MSSASVAKPSVRAARPSRAGARRALRFAGACATTIALALAATSASCASLSARDAAGNQWRAIADPADDAQGYVLERRMANGQLDPRFGRGGSRPLSISSTDDAPTGLRVDARGRIWVSGASIAGGQPQAVVLRYMPDGAPDLQWGIQGKVQLSPGGLAVKPNDLLPLSDGTVLVAGVAANVDPVRALVFHLKADGSLDTSFGTAGTWQRAGASDGSTATSLAANDGGAVAVSVAARGDKPVAEIWSIAKPAPRLMRQQPLDPDSDGEDLQAAWNGQRWVLTSAAGATIAGVDAALDPAVFPAGARRTVAASAPAEAGQGLFSPFSPEQEASSPAAVTPGYDESAWTPSAIPSWLVWLMAVAVVLVVAIRARRQPAPATLHKRKTY